MRGTPRRRRPRTILLLIAFTCAIAGITTSVGASEESDRLVATTDVLVAGLDHPLVADLQTVLTDLGIDTGPVDGMFGPVTEAAVRAFQRAAGITEDGVVGAETRTAFSDAVTDEAPRMSLSPGDHGDAVAALQRDLAEALLYRGPIDGDFGPMTASAVVAFHKIHGTQRSTTWTDRDARALAGWWPTAPGYGVAGTRVEVDLGSQVLYFVRGAELAAVMPVSSASGEYYTGSGGQRVQSYTPTGDFTVLRNVNGWDHSYLGDLYEPWYFSGGYAVHGSTSVPTYPASHGCIRVSIADAEWLDARMFVGIPVHIRG